MLSDESALAPADPRPREEDRTAMVVGAGLGGLTAALALLAAGWRVRVYEQAPFLGEVGAGVTLSPGTLKALAGLGVGADLAGASLPVPNIAFVHFRTGELLAGVFDKGRPTDHGFDTPRHIHRADLHAILLRAVLSKDPHAVSTGKRLLGVDEAMGGVTARFADETTARAAFLIAADGVRSTVRRQMFNDEAPSFAGQVAFRCLIPFDEAAPFMGRGNAVVFIGAARIFNRYLVRDGAWVNVIGIAKSNRWRDQGWSTPSTVEEFAAEFEGFHTDVMGLIRRSPDQTLIKWGLFTRPTPTEWSLGRIVLLGDAAHPILPFLGLGAALAIEDAVVLVRALGLAPTPERAFQAFRAARTHRVETVRAKSIEQGEIIQASDPDAHAVLRSPSQSVDLFDYDPCAAHITV